MVIIKSFQTQTIQLTNYKLLRLYNVENIDLSKLEFYQAVSDQKNHQFMINKGGLHLK